MHQHLAISGNLTLYTLDFSRFYGGLSNWIPKGTLITPRIIDAILHNIITQHDQHVLAKHKKTDLNDIIYMIQIPQV